MNGDTWFWVYGMVVSVAGGHYFSRISLWWLWGKQADPVLKFWKTVRGFRHIPSPLNKKPQEWRGGVPQWATGGLERIFFTLVVGYSGVGVGAGTMMVWLGIKTALNWRRYETKDPDELRIIIRASQVSTFTGLLSLLFALVGGLLIAVAIAPSLPVKMMQ